MHHPDTSTKSPESPESRDYWYSIELQTKILLALFCFCLTSISCSHSKDFSWFSSPDTGYGIQDRHLGYVPAKIAVLPCMNKPNGLTYKDIPLSNVNQKTVDQLCSAIDSQIIKSFTGQAFMKGSTPKRIKKLLSKSDNKDHLNLISENWRHRAEDCLICNNGASFYLKSIANRPDWRKWLNLLSKDTRDSDSILLPFLVFAHEERFNDRGLWSYRRSLGWLLFLIDTNDGSLLWSNARNAAVQKYEGEFPEWDQVLERALVEVFWDEFPGRQF